ncbi:CYTH domain-containing protein [Aquisalibacillus elongatus]|uniref:Adenylate cyclase n=1 Tax=Aquisalibacillus elongatus TaxID=485577 RepID=A0A3N5B395_9BACI|nr:CYTH domain-containing protein [Aquisalibacillus elongatus]RPF52116.1 adenylate cyclase [Aquisalibacillus elongatus]
MQELEIEFKNLLTKEQYHSLKQKWFSDETPQSQTNYYFETDDFKLKHNQAALRVRKKGNQYVATLKQPQSEGLLETHDPLTEDEAQNWFNHQVALKDNIKHQLQQMNIAEDHINYKGFLKTDRLEKTESNFTIVLDHSEYNGFEDYELEVEAPSYEEGLAFFQKLLNDYHIEQKPSTNKIQRFFQTLTNA